MDTVNYIVKKELPLSQDFYSLKKEALDYIHTRIGTEWTNFNPSDPGVTILEQFCYALTELGYCTDFSIQDILTNSNGKIEIDDQFYLPNEILTTAPYTIDDYKKYLIDGIQNIDNATIKVYNDNIFPFNRVYQVYLYINPNITDTDDICKSAFYYLNKSRNIGEIFNFPIALQPVNCWLGGKLELEKDTDQYAVLLELQDKIRAYIFPKVIQTSYGSLEKKGYTTAEIYNGPYLKNGWILTESLVDRKEAIYAIDLTTVIESVAGIVSISGIQLYQDGEMVSMLQSTLNEILLINIIESCKNKKLILSYNGKELPFDPFGPLQLSVDNFEETTNTINNNSSFALPKSNFRDINTYYSIQNTFPEQYGIGVDTIEENSNPHQIALSRQLKGYLTLFDQVLANQFSQLANISQLFSFKNSVYGAPSDEKTFYQLKDKYEKEHLQYPVPYQMFSPSYFYQSLYTVPHIKPLLKNNTTFNYSNGDESAAALIEKSWFEYQQDPYNPYIFGLMKLMEEEDLNLERRNKLLDHLLARHGESPIVIDSLIDDTFYTGDKRKDQIILKSLYLQNLGLLSYNRQKGYDYLSAKKIPQLIHGNLPIVKEEHLRIRNENMSDFVFESEKINKKEKLKKSDFSNFSALELKMNLMFGFRNLYLNFVSHELDPQKKHIEEICLHTSRKIQQTLWLTENKHGFLFIESILILKQLRFDFEIIKTGQTHTLTYKLDETNFQTVTDLNYILNTAKESEIDHELYHDYISHSGTKHYFTRIDKTIDNLNEFVKIGESNYSCRITIPSGNKRIAVDARVFRKDVLLIFPDFIHPLHKPEFKKRLKQFLKTNFPVNVSYECLFLSSTELEWLIPIYIYWYESLRHKNNLFIPESEQEQPEDNAAKAARINSVQCALNLFNSLTSILETKNGRSK